MKGQEERKKEKERNINILKREAQGLISLLASIAAQKIQVNDFLRSQGEEAEKDPGQIQDLAKRVGLSHEFVQAMLYFINNEPCVKSPVKIPQKQPERKKFFRKNLLELTRKIAHSYDEWYRIKAPFATELYLNFEQEVLMRTARSLKSTEKQNLAVDLGCATGRISLRLARDLQCFEQIKGFDVSPIMIQIAEREKVRGANMTLCQNVSFANIDIEEEIPIEENSASLVIMNLGTGSDIQEIDLLISRIRKILMKGGKFLLSFYNAGALYYQLSIPWRLGLAAKIDPIEHCLNVHVNGNDHLIYARPYTVREIKKLFQRHQDLAISQVSTYPTIASILPNEFFIEERSKKAIEAIDKKLVDMEKGAYILVTGRKA